MSKLKVLRFLIALLLIQVASPSSFPQGELQGESAGFIYYQRLIFIEIRVNSTEGLLFLLDTGASASAIDMKTAERLKIPLTGTDKVEGTAGVIDVRRAQIKSLSVGKARAENLSIPAYDLSSKSVPPGRNIDGILGYDFLRFFSVRVDFSNRTITFSLKSTKHSASRAPTATVPFELDNGIPRLRATLNGSVEADLRLDTGASIFETKDVYLNVTEEAWNELTALDPTLMPERYFKGSGVGGEIRLPVARIKNLSVGAVTISAPFVIVQPRFGYFARPDAVGFISNNFLERFSPVTLDYLDKKLYLSRSGYFELQKEQDNYRPKTKDLSWGSRAGALQMAVWTNPVTDTAFIAVRNSSSEKICYCQPPFDIIPGVYARRKNSAEWQEIKLKTPSGERTFVADCQIVNVTPYDEMPSYKWQTGKVKNVPIRNNYSFSVDLRQYDFPADWSGAAQVKFVQYFHYFRKANCFRPIKDVKVKSKAFAIKLPFPKTAAAE